jgi:hypothetical protein
MVQPTHVAIYARPSTQDQTLDAELRDLREYCSGRGRAGERGKRRQRFDEPTRGVMQRARPHGRPPHPGRKARALLFDLNRLAPAPRRTQAPRAEIRSRGVSSRDRRAEQRAQPSAQMVISVRACRRPVVRAGKWCRLGRGRWRWIRRGRPCRRIRGWRPLRGPARVSCRGLARLRSLRPRTVPPPGPRPKSHPIPLLSLLRL